MQVYDGTDYTILNTTVTYYYKNSKISSPSLAIDTFTSDTLADQKVFALEADEALANKGNFKWTASDYKVNGNDAGKFFINARGIGETGNNATLVIENTGSYGNVYTNNKFTGARPVFWISLK